MNDEWKNQPCREWTGPTNERYGTLAVGASQMYGVHRIAWILHHNAMPPRGMVVMHLCENPLCYEPTHLRLGTQSENMRHWLENSGSGAHRLTIEQVAQIKRRLLDGERVAHLAREFGCSPPNVSAIKAGKSWGWVEPAP